MFSSSTEEKVKNEILSSFTDPQSSLRVIVATIAFGMGLDVSSDSIEAYLQETGRCGRDGRDFFATLYYRKQDVASNSLVSGSESGRECVSLTNVTAPVHGHGGHNFFC
jgi:ATP-dependent DNA helicase RecQ